ncbi:hypothetical protein QBC40DRAFT_217858 [Triangularia verruculosa]|uniref:Uncharacterized protein n=1 Tax=Triangularia verruculosa TaxID=2587418 RepID=A0AAN7AYE1_9PEZI|nr:hypothetical protein QBC40DRAFT_217858 [Triangularia verruculosa]
MPWGVEPELGSGHHHHHRHNEEQEDISREEDDDASVESESESESGGEEEGGMEVERSDSDEVDGHQQQHVNKRRRIEGQEGEEGGNNGGGGGVMVMMENGNVAPVAGMGGGVGGVGVVDGSSNMNLGGGGGSNGNGDGDANNGNGNNGSNDGRVPHFKPGLPDPDDKGENDCFFEDCQTRAGGNQYFIKHLMDKHGLIRGDQGRQEGGRRKAPKYLAVCPTNWPFNYGTSSSCGVCSEITTLLNVVGEHNHESPAICSFCWTYFGDRAGLAAHINQGPCRSNEGFSRKLTLIRHMFATALRMPDGPELAKQSEGQRRAHAEAERAARAEKYAAEQAAEQEWRAQQQQVRRQRQQRGPGEDAVGVAVGVVAPVMGGAGGRRRNGVQQQQQQVVQQQQQAVQQHPAYVQGQQPAGPSPMGQQFAISAGGQPIDGLPNLQVQGGGVGQGVPEYAVPSAAAEAMARSIERLTGVIGDLTATNSQLLAEMRAREQHISNRDIQIRSREERINALSAENKKLSAEVARLTALVNGGLGMDGAGGQVVMGGGDVGGLDQGGPMEEEEV